MRTIAFLALATLWASTIATAQTTPTIVQDIDQSARNYYQKLALATTPCSGGVCNVVFPAIPAGVRTVVTHVSCDFAVFDGTTVYYASLSIQGTEFVTPLPLIAFPDVGGSALFGINSAVYTVLNHGQVPRIDIAYTGSPQPDHVRCTIDGYSVTLKN